jgi:hypothetical protein
MTLFVSVSVNVTQIELHVTVFARTMWGKEQSRKDLNVGNIKPLCKPVINGTNLTITVEQSILPELVVPFHK